MKNKINPNLLSDMEILETIKAEYLEVSPEGCLDFFKKRKRSPSLPYLNKRFNLTYNQILIKAGIPKENLKFVRKSKEECINIIKDLYMKLGHTPSAQQFTDEGYCTSVLINMFGSYNNAIKEAGLTPNTYKCKASLSRYEMIKKYKAFSKSIGKPASARDLDCSENIFCSGAFTLKFCGMNNLRRLAGFKEVESGNKLKYSKENIAQILIEESYKVKRHLTIAEINNNERLPASLTVLKYFKTTKFYNVWAEVDSLIVQTVTHNKNVVGYNKKSEYANNRKEIKKSEDRGEAYRLRKDLGIYIELETFKELE